MRLFEEVQKVICRKSGGKIKVSVPPAYSVVITNKTDDTVFLFPDFSGKVAYPLLKCETLEIENVTETSTFYTTIEDKDTANDKGLYILCRPFIDRSINIEENSVVIAKSKDV